MVIESERRRITQTLRTTRMMFGIMAAGTGIVLAIGGIPAQVVLAVNAIVYVSWVFDLTNEIRLIDDKLRDPDPRE